MYIFEMINETDLSIKMCENDHQQLHQPMDIQLLFFDLLQYHNDLIQLLCLHFFLFLIFLPLN